MPSNPNKQFISRQTGIPTNKYTIYFTCPIQEKFKYGKVYGKEIVSGTQDIRSKMRVVFPIPPSPYTRHRFESSTSLNQSISSVISFSRPVKSDTEIALSGKPSQIYLFLRPDLKSRWPARSNEPLGTT